MFAMFNNLFAALASLFAAFGHSATAVNNVALVAERKSQLFLMEQEQELREQANSLGLDVELTFQAKPSAAKTKQLTKA